MMRDSLTYYCYRCDRCDFQLRSRKDKIEHSHPQPLGDHQPDITPLLKPPPTEWLYPWAVVILGKDSFPRSRTIHVYGKNLKTGFSMLHENNTVAQSLEEIIEKTEKELTELKKNLVAGHLIELHEMMEGQMGRVYGIGKVVYSDSERRFTTDKGTSFIICNTSDTTATIPVWIGSDTYAQF